MYDALSLTKSDICVCDYFTDEKTTLNCETDVFESDEILIEYLNGRIYNRVFNKLYRIEVIKNIRFPKRRSTMEDGVWTPQVLVNSKKICRISTALYHYRVRADSIMNRVKTPEETFGYYCDVFERYNILISNIRTKPELENITTEFFKDTLMFIMSQWVTISNLFDYIKSIVIKNDLKLLIAIQNNDFAKMMFQLIRFEDTYQSVREKLSTINKS